MKKTVENLTKKVKNESQKIINCYQKKEYEYKSNVFDLPYTFLASVSNDVLKENINKLRGKYGIYMFIMNTDLNISLE